MYCVYIYSIHVCICTCGSIELLVLFFSLATGRDKGKEKLLANEKSNYKLLYQKVLVLRTCTHKHSLLAQYIITYYCTMYISYSSVYMLLSACCVCFPIIQFNALLFV